MSRLLLIRGLVLLFGCAGIAAHAAFSSIYVFGDSVSTTTTNQYADTHPTEYYGKRYCNGRAWVEVLAQRQGLGANSTSNSIWAYSSNNLSFYGHYSPLLVTNVNKFTAPANASNCLFVVWVCNADFVGDVSDPNVGAPGGTFSNGTNLLVWTTNINLHLTNHFKAITNLYGKGMRTLVAPNAVNIMLAPQFNQNSDTNYKAFVRQRIVSFNAAYATMMQQLQATSLGLKIYVPDMFGIFDAAVTNAAAYGLTNALYSGQPIDVIEASSPVVGLLPNANTNGLGTNYVFWDPVSPSARTHELFADVAQQALSPVDLADMAQVNTSNRLDIVNVPVGLNGTVLYATNLTQPVWLTNSTFSSLTLTQSVFVTPTNAQRFYQLKLPYAWTWP
ncbi:MAG TPA: SGNH/GDSL hydrolase family protein [Candidatus Acidoferrales bacterium]|nr:SGNH/GDSL hydrolase family protein [Candidatus Acidoferrales bacterium]